MAARGAVAVRGFAGVGRADPRRAARRPGPLAAPERPRGRASRRSTGSARSSPRPRAEAGIATVGDLLYRFPHSHRDRQIRPLETLEPGETGTVLVTVLGNPPRPFRRGKLTMVGVKVGDETGSVRATWFNQPWVSGEAGKGLPDPDHRQAQPERAGGAASGSWWPRRPRADERRRRSAPARSSRSIPATEDLPPKKIREWAEQAVPLAPQRDRGAARGAQAKRRLRLGRRGDPCGALPRLGRGSSRRRAGGSASKSCSSTRRSWRRASAATARARPAPRFGKPGADGRALARLAALRARPTTSAPPSPTSTSTSTRASRCSGC